MPAVCELGAVAQKTCRQVPQRILRFRCWSGNWKTARQPGQDTWVDMVVIQANLKLQCREQGTSESQCRGYQSFITASLHPPLEHDADAFLDSGQEIQASEAITGSHPRP
jgi:hypothetical protein